METPVTDGTLFYPKAESIYSVYQNNLDVIMREYQSVWEVIGFRYPLRDEAFLGLGSGYPLVIRSFEHWDSRNGPRLILRKLLQHKGWNFEYLRSGGVLRPGEYFEADAESSQVGQLLPYNFYFALVDKYITEVANHIRIYRRVEVTG